LLVWRVSIFAWLVVSVSASVLTRCILTGWSRALLAVLLLLVISAGRRIPLLIVALTRRRIALLAGRRGAILVLLLRRIALAILLIRRRVGRTATGTATVLRLTLRVLAAVRVGHVEGGLGRRTNNWSR